MIVHVSSAGVTEQVRVPLRRIQASRLRDCFHEAQNEHTINPSTRAHRATVSCELDHSFATVLPKNLLGCESASA